MRSADHNSGLRLLFSRNIAVKFDRAERQTRSFASNTPGMTLKRSAKRGTALVHQAIRARSAHRVLELGVLGHELGRSWAVPSCSLPAERE